MRIPWSVLAITCFIGSSLAQQHEKSQGTHAQHSSSPDTELAEDHLDKCAASYEAQAILRDLAPPPNAHLEKKLGTLSSISSRGWGEGLGWGHEGPLSTASRLLPRSINSLLSPLSFLSRSPGSGYITTGPSSDKKATKKIKISKARWAKIEAFWANIDEAEKEGCVDVHAVKARVRMFPPRGIRQDSQAAYSSYEKSLEYKPDPEAQFMIGMFHSTGLGGISEDHAKTSLYYTFSALQGYKPAEMAMGYRHWAGIGVKEDCLTALDYYEGAAEKAYAHFLSGPPGGRTLPLTTARSSDLVGGIYGPHASWASTGANALRPAVRAASASARGETEAEVLEYYQYHSDRDSHSFTVRLGRLFYLGSVYPILGGSPRGPGVSAGAEGVGEIPQSFTKAREYFTRVARTLWPGEFDSKGKVVPKRKLSKEVEDGLREPAMVAAAFLGRMALRGEGQKVDYKRARLWYERAAELGDREAFNGSGIIHRDGLGTPKDPKKAFHFFQGAAGQDSAEAQVNSGKLHMDRGEVQQAFQYFESAVRHGSPFEAFHLLAKIYATTARLPSHAGGERGNCGVSVAYFKIVSERGSWQDDFVGEGDRAWARGEEDVALVRWLVAAEMGSEIGQNNVAFSSEGGRGEQLFPGSTKSLAMRHWVRSAAKLSGSKVSPVLKNSQLPQDKLSKIWELSDIDSDGNLDFEEFCIAMRLIFDIVNGSQSDVPAELPGWLIPASKAYLIQANRAVATGNNQYDGGRSSNDDEEDEELLSDDFDWYISPTDKATYESIYNSNSDSYGRVRFQSLEGLYQTLTKVPKESISSAWNLVNPKSFETIDKDQTLVFLHILNQRENGKRVPHGVPASLRATFSKETPSYDLSESVPQVSSPTSANNKKAFGESYLQKVGRSTTNERGTDFSATEGTDWEEVRLRRELANLEDLLNKTSKESSTTQTNELGVTKHEYEQLLKYKEEQLKVKPDKNLTDVKNDIELIEGQVRELEQYYARKQAELQQLDQEIAQLS